MLTGQQEVLESRSSIPGSPDSGPSLDNSTHEIELPVALHLSHLLDVVERAGAISSLVPHELLRTMKGVDDCAMLASSSGVPFEILCRLTLAPPYSCHSFSLSPRPDLSGIAAVFEPPQISTQIRQNYPVVAVITQSIWEMSESRSI